MSLRSPRSAALGAGLLVLMLAACRAAPQVATAPAVTATEPVEVGPTETPAPAPARTAAPAPTPTEPAREFRPADHSSGVFGLSLPAGWETVDESIGERLLVRYLPPPGYGSRIRVEVTHEGPQTPGQVGALVERYVRLHYGSGAAYEEISREDGPDGETRLTFRYDDGQGGAGQETVILRQAGPYFAALSVFLAGDDAPRLTQALETVESSFRVEPLAQWRPGPVAVNPAELIIANTALWEPEEDASGWVYSGEVSNVSPGAVTDVEVRVVLCDARSVVVSEYRGETGLTVIPAGGSSPFALRLGDLAAGLSVCSEQAEAVAAPQDTPVTTALQVEAGATGDAETIFVQGQVANPGLASVTDVRLVAAAYDGAGRVVGVATSPLGVGLVLEPGQAAPFEVSVTVLDAEAARTVVLAEARIIVDQNHSLAPEEDEG